VTSQGSAQARFQRFVEAGLLTHAETAARELGKLSLADGLAFVALLAENNDSRFDVAAARWLRRLHDERGPLNLAATQLGCAALTAFRSRPVRPVALRALVDLSQVQRVPNVERALAPVLRRWNDAASDVSSISRLQ
jgi:hypothetical protein